MDAFAGAIGVSDSDGKSTPVYAACVPREEYPVNSYFYAYLLRYMAHSGYIESLSKGIRERSTDFRFSEFRELSLPVPPQKEQESIVACLDRKAEEINVAIEKKERLIDLLTEQKGILINQAVSVGLNPGATLRESGVDWIGRAPSHWNVIRAKYLFSEIDERSQTGTEELLSVSHMTGVTSRSEKTNVYMFMAEDYTGAKLCRPGDLVMNNRRSTGLHSSRLRLYSNMFLDMEIAVPPREEQNEIERQTRERVNQADAVIAATQREIEKLLEFRAALIERYVTGKIRA